MGIFKRKNEKNTVQVRINDPNRQSVTSNNIARGCRTKKQLLSPAGVSYPSENELLVENNYMRAYTIDYPSRVGVGILDKLYSYPGDMDVIHIIEPTEEKEAIDELTKQITKYESQNIIQSKNGSVKDNTSIPAKLESLYAQRSKLEKNIENMFKVTSAFDIFGPDSEQLNKESQTLVAKLNGKRIHSVPLTLREDDGFRTISPFGINLIPDHYRNANTGALSAFFPFYNPEFCHEKGTFIGVNKQTNTATIIDFFDRKVLGNANVFITGQSGFGKTVLASLLVLRSLPDKVRTVILDIENEYGKCTDIAGGITIKIAPDSDAMINPFDIDEEYRLDKNGDPTGIKYVNIKGKIAELLNLFCVMVPECANSDMKSIISDVLQQLYSDFGFTEDVKSLYTTVSIFNEETSEYHNGQAYKTMPRMTDFYERLTKTSKLIGDTLLEKITTAFRMFVQGGLYDMFDCYSTVDLDEFRTAPVIRFDLSQEDTVLSPLIMHVVTTWTWNKFIKKDRDVRKRILSDETWRSLADKYIAGFLEDCGRRIRKYNGQLVCASQNFREFKECKEGRAIIANSAVKIFLHQPEEDIGEVEEKFILSEGEKRFVLTAGVGEALIKIGGESIAVDILRFPFEVELFKDLDKKLEKKGVDGQ